VSENYNCQHAGTIQGTPEEVADVTCWGRLFQVRAAATGKADRRRWTAVYD